MLNWMPRYLFCLFCQGPRKRQGEPAKQLPVAMTGPLADRKGPRKLFGELGPMEKPYGAGKAVPLPRLKFPFLRPITRAEGFVAPRTSRDSTCPDEEHRQKSTSLMSEIPSLLRSTKMVPFSVETLVGVYTISALAGAVTSAAPLTARAYAK